VRRSRSKERVKDIVAFATSEELFPRFGLPAEL
jgi:hypothetical protein